MLRMHGLPANADGGGGADEKEGDGDGEGAEGEEGFAVAVAVERRGARCRRSLGALGTGGVTRRVNVRKREQIDLFLLTVVIGESAWYLCWFHVMVGRWRVTADDHIYG